MNWINGVGCIHNPKVGGSIPPPATNNTLYFNELRASSSQTVLAFAEILPRMK
jgi:hypothetical protein